jgi:hypothetical protein
MANEDLKRIVGDEAVLKILGNPDLRLHKPGEGDPRKLLEAVLGVYGGKGEGQ